MDWVLLGLRVVTIVILYTFLGIAFYIIWRSLKQAGVEAIEPKRRQRLRVISAGDEPVLSEGAAIPLQQVTLLGQTTDNVFVVNDASVANGHARIYQTDGSWWLEDLGHHNSTLLNELPVVEPALLVDGDVIGIGPVRLKLELDETQVKGEE